MKYRTYKKRYERHRKLGFLQQKRIWHRMSSFSMQDNEQFYHADRLKEEAWAQMNERGREKAMRRMGR